MKRSVQYASMLATLLAGSLAHAGSNHLPNYSAYAGAQGVTGPLAGEAVPREFLAGVTSIDEKRGVPTIFWAAQDGVLAPGGAMARSESAAQYYLQHYAALYGLGQGGIDAAHITQVHDIGRGGIIVVFKQKANGLDVYHTELKVLMTPMNELVAITGNLNSMAAPTTKRVAPFTLGFDEAIAHSFNDYFLTKVPSSAFSDTNRRAHGYSYFEFRETAETSAKNIGLARPARIKQVYYPLPDKLVPAYYIELAASDNTTTSILYGYVISAVDGALLERVSLTSDASFQYRVWNEGAPNYTPPDGPQADFAPHPTGTPNGTSPAFVAPSLITVDGFNTNPMNTFDPWLLAGATSTNGNNVDAYVDFNAPDGLTAGDFRATTTAAGVFDRVYNTAQAPNVNMNQRQAAITQLFVNNNYSHDYWYDSGFNEAAGNAQANNYGRGGAEGDPIHAEAQDSSGTNNANMQTPADGESPIMQMYIFSPSQLDGGPNRDGAIDNGIVSHEWGHYIHNRLATGGTQQFGSQGEGWGDFVAMMQLVRSNDNYAGTFATGVYAAAAFGDSGYYGIRRYPYSSNFTKNGLTFKHIGDGIALPAGVAPGFGNIPNSEVHNAGEIWCSMMWEAYGNLLEDTVGAMPRHTFAQAKRKMADYVVAGLKLTPTDSTFTETRDSLLAAALAGGNAADLQDLMAGFATRGAGACAVSPARDSADLLGVVEDFTANRANAKFVSFSLTETTPSCDNDGIVDVGEGGLVTIKLQNTGWASLTGATVTVTTTNPNISFPGGNSVNVPATAMLGTQTLTFPISVGAAVTNPTYLPFNIVINAPGTCTAMTTVTQHGEVNYDVTVPNTAAGVVNETFEGAKTWASKLTSGMATPLWGVARPTVPTPIGLNETAWGQDVSGISDHTLESPDLVVGNAGLSVTFQHRYEFERSNAGPPNGNQNWDGGVVEISQDGGMTWADVTTFAGVNAGYTGAISTLAGNPLAGRQGYGGTSNGFATGGLLTRTLNFGAALNNKTVRMRFRIGTDEAVGAGGWYIDNVNFTGLTNKPFSAQVNHNCLTATCGNGTLNAGEQCDDGNTMNGDCCSSTCTFESAATVCRAAVGTCDVAESCTGMSGTCPADMKAANGTMCNDNNGCTQTDTCNNGTCTGANPITCMAQDACHVVGACDPMTGMCSNPNAPNGTMCNDNNACTQMDSCNNGACTGSNPVMCAAQDACHVAGSCDPMTGMCSNPNAPDGTACNDNNACSQTDSCQNGSCVGSNPTMCMPSDQCHVAGSCDMATGMCSNPNAADGTTCSDGNLCTVMDSCTNGACAGTAVNCPADECHDVGTCDQATGMCNNPNKADGTPCNNGTGTCQAGTCTTGSGGAGGTGGTGGTAGAGGAGGAGGTAGAGGGGMGGTAGAGGDAGMGGSAGTGGKGGSAGAGGSAGGGGEAGAGGGTVRPPVLTEGGCDCSIPGNDAPMRDTAGGLLALVGAWLVRRRRSSKAS